MGRVSGGVLSVFMSIEEVLLELELQTIRADMLSALVKKQPVV